VLEPSELFPEVPNLYDFLSVHADMVYDEERVSRYSEAISSTVKAGDVVVDIGTGTGLLAFLCLRAGARHVHAVERSSAIEWAKLLAGNHGFADRMTFYAGDSREVALTEKVDVVVSELIGHIAFEEGMAQSLLDARARFLRQGGALIPRKLALVVAPVCERDVYETCVNRWRPAWGIDYSALREHAVKSCYLTEINSTQLMAVPASVFTMDFADDIAPSELTGSHCFTIRRPGEVNGLAMWFDAELAPRVHLSSGPWKRTHWQQTFAPISSPLRVDAGDRVRATLRMHLGCSRRDAFRFELAIEGGG